MAAKLVLDTPALEKLVLWVGNQETRETAERNPEWCGKGLVGETGRWELGVSVQWPKEEREAAHPTPGGRWRLSVSTGTEWRVELV